LECERVEQVRQMPKSQNLAKIMEDKYYLFVGI